MMWMIAVALLVSQTPVDAAAAEVMGASQNVMEASPTVETEPTLIDRINNNWREAKIERDTLLQRLLADPDFLGYLRLVKNADFRRFQDLTVMIARMEAEARKIVTNDELRMTNDGVKK